MPEARSDKGPKASSTVRWRQSLLGKMSCFLLVVVVLAYATGALTGWMMLARGQQEEWRRQAEINAQIVSAAIRSIYTFVSVETRPSGQIVGIVTDRLIGDDLSVLDTGFNPADVLALAAAQTKQPVWLFRFDTNSNQFLSMTDGDASPGGQHLSIAASHHEKPLQEARFFTGFLSVDGVEHYAGFLPIRTQNGQLLGAVASSIGTAESLLLIRSAFYRNSFLLLTGILLATGIAVALLIRRMFHPVPALIHSLNRIAEDDTSNVTPFLTRRDEIGHLARTIETLRAAVVEREHLRDIRETAREMEHLAHHDPLTGLPNRAHLQKFLDTTLTTAVRDNRTVNVMLLDLDRFKPVNDTYGHAAGDRILIMTSERITALIGAGDMFARLGGDEFALVQIVAFDARKEGERLAARVIDAVSQPYQVNGNTVHVGASIGVTCAPEDGNTGLMLLANADLALYTCKAEGRGRFAFFELGMRMPQLESARNERTSAPLLEDLELHYQPIVDLVDGAITGYEALLRWNHPKRGQISPDLFIPAAESTGQILDIGQWVLMRACRDAASWPDHLTVSVNVSAIQIQSGDLAAIVHGALADSGLAAERLEIELTESVLIDPTQALPTMKALRASKIGIAIDDFGTGFANLVNLTELPFTRIKLDRRFIAGLENSSVYRDIVAGTVAMAHRLGLSTTAEGVESAHQGELLRACGCQSAQGYHYGRPQALPIVAPVSASAMADERPVRKGVA